jgi:hypothetical protein
VSCQSPLETLTESRVASDVFVSRWRNGASGTQGFWLWMRAETPALETARREDNAVTSAEVAVLVRVRDLHRLLQDPRAVSDASSSADGDGPW